ncbi:MAG: hypothetical protein WC817_02935 [Patescibacteria group bacterium]|jgi:hypothetical protein
MSDSKEKDLNKPAFDEPTRKRMHEVVLAWLQKHGSESNVSTPTIASARVPSSPLPVEEKPKKELKTAVRRQTSAPQEIKKQAVILDPSHELASPRMPLLLTSGSHLHTLLRKFVTVAVYAFVGVHILAALLVYGFKQTNGVAQVLSNFVPLPYAFVSYHPIFYSEINKETDALDLFYSQQTAQNVRRPTRDDIHRLVTTAITRRLVAEELARRRGIWVTEKDIDAALAKVVEQAGSLDKVKGSIKQLWGWRLSEYRYYVLRPYLVKEQLLVAFSEDPIIKRELPAGSSIQSLDRYLDKVAPTMLKQVGP